MTDQATDQKYIKTASGLQYFDIEAGKGEKPQAGQIARITYSGWLADGTKFDSSMDRREIFEFKLGAGKVVKGMDEGVSGMRVGGRRRILIPPQLGYGAQGNGSTIPPDATLGFEILLVGLAVPQFPYYVFDHTALPGDLGELLRKLRPWSMFPPFPWGQWIYSKVYMQVCSKLEGDLIELGVGLGGMSFLFGHLAKANGKKVLSFDSFEGLPEPDEHKDNPYFIKGDYESSSEWATPLIDRFNRARDLLGLTETVTATKGFFEDTLPGLPPEQKFCMVHMDSDLYYSIYVSLEHVYDKTVEGGAIIFDDYFHPAQGPLRAAVDFFNARGITPIFHVSFPYSVFVIKGEEADLSKDFRSVDGNIYSLEWLRSDKHFLSVLNECLEQMEQGSRPYENCKMFIDLMNNKHDTGRDIYTYWKVLEDFWDQTAKGLAVDGVERAANQI